MLRRVLVRSRWAPICVAGLSVGCASQRIIVPNAQLPTPTHMYDAQTAMALAEPAPKAEPIPQPPATNPPAKDGTKSPSQLFKVPEILPGSDTPPVKAPQFEEGANAQARQEKVQKGYPELVPVSANLPVATDATPLTLTDLQQIALTNSPVIRKAVADADVAYGVMIQAGLYPNPTVGYQADQWQPGLMIPPGSSGSGNGQQGGFVNQLIKTAHKLSLAQQVAGYDYVNSYVAVRRSQIDVTTQVRTFYFSALVAKQTLDYNKALADMADEVYQIQLKQLAAGITAGYEPYQIYAQAVQARNAMTQAEATYRAAWKQLAAAVGQPNMPFAPLAGNADASVPAYNLSDLQARILEQHTDILTAKNSIFQAQTNLTLQKRIPIPDLQTNSYHQYDNLAQTYQFGVQLGISLPIADRNQGNIRAAIAKMTSSREQLQSAQNDLQGRSAEAFTRYEANRVIAANYHDKIIPAQMKAYRTIILRWQIGEPGSVQFNDIVTTQLSLAQSIQTYLSALDAQWKAVVDLANVSQLDDLYAPSPAVTVSPATTPVPTNQPAPGTMPAPGSPAPMPGIPGPVRGLPAPVPLPPAPKE